MRLLSTIFQRLASKWRGAKRLVVLSREKGDASLTEILVTCVVGMLLMTMICTAIGQVQYAGKLTRCMSNIRQVHQALLLYYEANEAFPVLAEGQSLQEVLRPQLGNVSDLFHCPEDRSPGSDSYSYFYAPRTIDSAPDCYVLGCPRHRKSSRGVIVFAGSQAEYQNTASILHDGKVVQPGQEMDSGSFTFADGSQASISNGASGNGGGSNGNSQAPDRPRVSTLFSYRMTDGSYYTVVKMKDGQHGTATFSVVPGNHFEVVTPSAVIAVRGTQFSVTTLVHGNGKPATRVEVTSGTVDMEPVAKGIRLRLTGEVGKNKGYVVQGESPHLE